jgi:transposase
MVVDSVVLEGRSIRVTAQRYGVSKSWVFELVRRYKEGGAEELVPQSKAPKTNPRSVGPVMEERVIAMRKELRDFGGDAGAETIHWHLEEAGFSPPSVATIYRLLRRRGFITPEPRKRPRASYVRFEASLPNECWQSDMTHWHLSDGTEVEILTFLDDYSRRVMACDVFVTVTGPDVRQVLPTRVRCLTRRPAC